MDNLLIGFVVQIVLISLSGVIAPGPITAATLAAGARSRHAGSRIATGHAVVEVPLMLLVGAGAGRLLALKPVTIGIGLGGGAVLVLMGGGMLRSLSFTSFKGTKVFGDRAQRIVLAVCSVALVGLGLFFVLDALKKM